MKRLNCFLVMIMLAVGLWQHEAGAAAGRQLAEITAEDRCPVCGMFVAKYPTWIAQVVLSDGRVEMFDGPKDMLVYYFSPEEYGANGAQVVDIVVRDYYSLRWIDAKEAYFVTGSDVYGPMGHEFIPFSTREAAESFLQDHHGKQILTLSTITDKLVQGMRMGHGMKRGKK